MSGDAFGRARADAGGAGNRRAAGNSGGRRALRYRLFGIGKMPAELAQAAGRPGVALAVEGISVKESVSDLVQPRTRVRQGTKLLIGSVVLSGDRVLLGVGSHQIVDWELGSAGRPDQWMTLGEDGIRVGFDVAGVVRAGSGKVELNFRLRLDEGVLGGLGSGACAVTLTNVGPALLDGWKGSWSR